jgi:hypothetical protein
LSLPDELNNYTSYPEVNAILRELAPGIQGVLGNELVGLYLDGSLANGGFDQDSDIDFVAVTREKIDAVLFQALQSMHERIAALDLPFADQIEGSYIPQDAIRRYDPAHALHPNLERGTGERLKWALHDEPWAVHRWVLRERGVTLVGPDPKTLIDPVSPEELRAAMRVLLHGWAAGFLEQPEKLDQRGYQSYVVLSLCRLLCTLQSGEVVSKNAASAWAIQNLGKEWRGLIGRAWDGRHQGGLPAESKDVHQTLELIRYAHLVDPARPAA